MGVSDKRLTEAFTGILQFGGMREDQVRFTNADLN